ncbi:MAG: family 10 glycosylhydrolase [Bacteroidota bacterium]|nr:family 10 glycosylhydrolase [Candidatus Kapabacteria bacterium]MDW8219339.1 family 10 glycosylhydrolase [Bacteroidota bacterium]
MMPFFNALCQALLLLYVLCSACAPQQQGPQVITRPTDTTRPATQTATPEVRGVWLTLAGSTVFDSRQNIATAMRILKEHGFNTVFPVVWARGYTLWRSQRMEREFGMPIGAQFGSRDVLRETIEEARLQGLAVIPWFEYGFATFNSALGTPPGAILAKYPQWACIGRDGQIVVKNGFYWMNALDSTVQNFMTDLIMEVVNNYDIDGIQGDDRMPAMPSEGGYDSATVTRYRRETGRAAPQDFKDSAWVAWRANKLTEWLARLRQTVKARKSSLIFAMSPSPFPFGQVEYLQDSPTWMQRGLVDLLSTQLYRRDLPSYQTLLVQLQSQMPISARRKMAPGVLGRADPFIASAQLLSDCITANRTAGMIGSAIFYYEALTPNNNENARALRQGVYRLDAAFPRDSLLRP